MKSEETNQIIHVAIKQHLLNKSIMERLMKPLNTGSDKSFNGTLDISDEQFLQLDKTMNMYDCAQYAKIMKYSNKWELLLYADDK